MANLWCRWDMPVVTSIRCPRVGRFEPPTLHHTRSLASARDAVAPGAFNKAMPWTQYGQMTEQDIGAIYTYLMSLPAIENSIVRFTPGT